MLHSDIFAFDIISVDGIKPSLKFAQTYKKSKISFKKIQIAWIANPKMCPQAGQIIDQSCRNPQTQDRSSLATVVQKRSNKTAFPPQQHCSDALASAPRNIPFPLKAAIITGTEREPPSKYGQSFGRASCCGHFAKPPPSRSEKFPSCKFRHNFQPKALLFRR